MNRLDLSKGYRDGIREMIRRERKGLPPPAESHIEDMVDSYVTGSLEVMTDPPEIAELKALAEKQIAEQAAWANCEYTAGARARAELKRLHALIGDLL